ncbi:MAG: PhzF family phenazine biosynthesis isomerase [Bacteroidales bacterium]
MTKPKIIYQVDAFTSKPFKGNPAAVCILEKKMPDQWMQNVAAEMNLSETSFVLPGKKESPIRFFTPVAEIPLCGHATLSTGHIFFETGIAQKNEEIIFISKAGRLKIRTSGNWIVMNFPAYSSKPLDIPAGIEDILGVVPSALFSTGHGWKLALLNDEKSVLRMKPDFDILNNSGYGDLIVTAPSDDKNFDFCVRCFAPALGINEDPVTGSAHCALTPFWKEKTGKSRMVSHQVSEREGILKVETTGERVEISGQAKTILKGELFV